MSGVVHFIVEDDRFKVEKPYGLLHPGIPEDLPAFNYSYGPKSIVAEDLRTLPESEQPTLERNGVQWVKQDIQMPSSLGHENIVLNAPEDIVAFEDEMGGWIKKLFNAETVVSMTTNTRSTLKNETGYSYVGLDAHADTSLESMWPVACRILTPEEQNLVETGKYRLRVVSAWRPVGGPVQDYPIAVVDANTVTGDDFYTSDSVSPYYALETLHLRYKPDYRWLYISNQTQEDVIMWSQFDTHPPNNLFPLTSLGTETPHAAVKINNPPPDCAPRRSIDMRYIVLTRAPPGSQRVPFPTSKSPETRKQPWKGRVSFIDVHPPRYVLPVSKTSMCRIGKVAENTERFTAVSAN